MGSTGKRPQGIQPDLEDDAIEEADAAEEWQFGHSELWPDDSTGEDADQDLECPCPMCSGAAIDTFGW
jgi:hypothetical protein